MRAHTRQAHRATGIAGLAKCWGLRVITEKATSLVPKTWQPQKVRYILGCPTHAPQPQQNRRHLHPLTLEARSSVFAETTDRTTTSTPQHPESYTGAMVFGPTLASSRSCCVSSWLVPGKTCDLTRCSPLARLRATFHVPRRVYR